MLKSDRGITLLEIAIALVILALGISMAMRTLPMSTSSTTKGANLTKATNLAQEKVEELMDLDFNNSELSAGTHDDTNTIDDKFSRYWTVVANSPVTDMKTITVTVAYPPGGADDNVTITTTMTSGR
jgi:prepilin-type N-terminal cleavage/methylation domain-containing protein